MLSGSRLSAARKSLLQTAAVCAVCFVVLRLMGQPAWCSCGSRVPWSWDIWTSHNSQHLIDPYWFTHVLHGVGFCWILWWLWPTASAERGYQVTLLAEAAWEIWENTPFVINRYRDATISLSYFGDSALNSVSDIVGCMLGYVLARWLGFWKSVAFFAVTEIVLALTIRDGLVLNIVMLVCPIDAVKAWQMGQ